MSGRGSPAARSGSSAPRPRRLLTRRRLLRAGGGLGAVATGLAVSSAVPPSTADGLTVAGRARGGPPQDLGWIVWGADPERQRGRLYLPPPEHRVGGADAASLPVIVLYHGGGWRDSSGPTYVMGIAQDLARYGAAVWLPTYRGTPSPGGWPQTLQDAAAALDFVAELHDHAPFRPDLQRVHVAGHSSGGHLAAWLAGRAPAQPRLEDTAPGRVVVRSATSLAGVLDLVRAVEEDHDQFVVDLLGGRPDRQPRRYRQTSPMAQLPAVVPINVVHGRADATVPVSTIEPYARELRAAGNPGRVELLDGVAHNDLASAEHWSWRVAREVCLDSVERWRGQTSSAGRRDD